MPYSILNSSITFFIFSVITKTASCKTNKPFAAFFKPLIVLTAYQKAAKRNEFKDKKLSTEHKQKKFKQTGN